MTDHDYCRCLRWADMGPMLADVRVEVRSRELPVTPNDWADSITDQMLELFESGDRDGARAMLVSSLEDRAAEPVARRHVGELDAVPTGTNRDGAERTVRLQDLDGFVVQRGAPPLGEHVGDDQHAIAHCLDLHHEPPVGLRGDCRRASRERALPWKSLVSRSPFM